MVAIGKPERVAIFIDGSNLYHSVKETFGVHDNEIDFKMLIEYLRKGRLLVSVYYYNAPLDRSHNQVIYSKQQKFFAELQKIPGFHVVLCNMRKIRKPGGSVEYAVKGDDIYLATDMLSLAYEDSYDVAVLVSGDGDFAPAIKKVQKLGKKVENAYMFASRSGFLRNICDDSVPLDQPIEGFIRK